MKYLWSLTCLSLGLNKKGESSVTLKTTGHERTHFTCVLSCTASGQKLPPMVIFKRMTMQKEKLPKEIAVKVNSKGWMIESLMKDWLTECYGKRLGAFFHRKKSIAHFGHHEGQYNRFCESSHQGQTQFHLRFLGAKRSICSHSTSVWIVLLKWHSELSAVHCSEKCIYLIRNVKNLSV